MRKIFVALALSLAVFNMTISSFAAETKKECTEKECSEKASKMALATFKFADAKCKTSCKGVDMKLTSIKGLQAPKTCSVSKNTTFKYDPSKMTDKKLLASFKKAGLKIEAQLVDFDIQGMACTACQSKVSKALTSVKGVKTNAVCHKSGSAKVAFDPAVTDKKKILSAVKELGYKVSVKMAKAEAPSK